MAAGGQWAVEKDDSGEERGRDGGLASVAIGLFGIQNRRVALGLDGGPMRQGRRGTQDAVGMESDSVNADRERTVPSSWRR